MEGIILIGHGSPLKEANNIEHMANILRSICNIESIEIAYLQFAEPDLMTAIANTINKGAKRVIIHPYFLTSGAHVTKDMPEIVKEARGLYPQVEFIITEPLGIHEKLAQVVFERINSAWGSPKNHKTFLDTAGGLKPEDIEKRSFKIISEEIDLSDLPEEQIPIVKRVIHATADFDFKKNLLFHPEAIRAGIDAIKSGKDILVDVKMVESGINRRLLSKWGGKVICNIQNSELQTAALSLSKGPNSELLKTRAERGIEMGLKENNNIGIIAIGNAPTALLKVIEILTLDPCPLTLVVGVPVGFVKAVESKALLSSQGFPFITSLGRKGGSPVAAAIVNALLKMAEGGDK